MICQVCLQEIVGDGPCPHCRAIDELQTFSSLEDVKYNVPPWIPETNPGRLAILGKLLEELGECTAITARSLIQGIDARDPDTAMPNRLALEDELADVDAAIRTIAFLLRLDTDRMLKRSDKKAAHFLRWNKKLQEMETP